VTWAVLWDLPAYPERYAAWPAIIRGQSAAMMQRRSGIGRSGQQGIDAQPGDAGAGDDPPA
jgi:hypothetical protein